VISRRRIEDEVDSEDCFRGDKRVPTARRWTGHWLATYLVADGVLRGGERKTGRSTRATRYRNRGRRHTSSERNGTSVIAMSRCSIAPILTGGSKKTAEFASQHHKPCIHIHERMLDGPQRLKEFLEANEVRTLNVAGPRASNEPQVGQFVFATLDRVRVADGTR
jgi:Circularly permutated YpsA SLOG family